MRIVPSFIKSKKYWSIIIIVITTIGFIFRLKGIDFGLPFVYDEDESRRVQQAFNMLVKRNPNPEWFGHPASTLIYLMAASELLIFFAGRIVGIFDNFADFQQLYFENPTIFYWIGRGWLIIFGTGSIVVTYLIGKRLGHQSIGIIAAVLLAFSPLHIKYSKMIRSDVLMTLLILLSFLYCLKILENNNRKNYMMAGIFSGLATVTKYPAIIINGTILLTHLVVQNWKITPVKNLMTSIKACLLSAFLMSPFLFFNFSRTLGDIKHEGRSNNVGATGEGFISNMIWYFQEPLKYNLTIIGIILLIVGLGFCLFSRNKSTLILVSFPLLFFIFISLLSLRWERWIIPILPFAYLIVAYGLYQISQKINKLALPIPLYLLIASTIVGTIVYSLSQINQGEIREITGLDTRTIAREWIMNNIPQGKVILVDEGPPPISVLDYSIFEVDNRTLSKITVENTRHEFVGVEIQSIGKLEDVEEIIDNKIEYLILSWKYFLYLEEKDNYPEVIATYNQIISLGHLIQKIERNNQITSGPTVEIYRIS